MTRKIVLIVLGGVLLVIGALVAADREAARPDRIPGMAVAQAEAVHVDVVYDVEVDTTDCSVMDCARWIAEAALAPRSARRSPS